MLPQDVNYYKLMFNHGGYQNTTQNGANELLLKLIIKNNGTKVFSIHNLQPVKLMTHILAIQFFVREMHPQIQFYKFKDLPRSFGILLGT